MLPHTHYGDTWVVLPIRIFSECYTSQSLLHLIIFDGTKRLLSNLTMVVKPFENRCKGHWIVKERMNVRVIFTHVPPQLFLHILTSNVINNKYNRSLTFVEFTDSSLLRELYNPMQTCYLLVCRYLYLYDVMYVVCKTYFLQPAVSHDIPKQIHFKL